MNDTILKTIVVITVAVLLLYWGLTGTDPSYNWVAIVTPVLSAVLFKSDNKTKDKTLGKFGSKVKDMANERKSREEGMDSSSLRVFVHHRPDIIHAGV